MPWYHYTSSCNIFQYHSILAIMERAKTINDINKKSCYNSYPCWVIFCDGDLFGCNHWLSASSSLEGLHQASFSLVAKAQREQRGGRSWIIPSGTVLNSAILAAVLIDRLHRWLPISQVQLRRVALKFWEQSDDWSNYLFIFWFMNLTWSFYLRLLSVSHPRYLTAFAFKKKLAY